MVTQGNLVEICIRISNDATVQKITISFCNISVTLAVGPRYWAISTDAPLRDCTIPRLPTLDNDL